MGGNEDKRAILFSLVSIDRRKSYGHKQKKSELMFKIRKTGFTMRLLKHWYKLPREIAVSILGDL